MASRLGDNGSGNRMDLVSWALTRFYAIQIYLPTVWSRTNNTDENFRVPIR